MNGRLPIAQIIVGERRREDLGDIEGLATSIARYGLLHPLVVDADGRLVAGGRRLMACLQLGWREVDVRALGELTDAELREIELEENLRRKDLSEYERSRDLTQLAETAAEVLIEEAHLRPESGRKSRGHPTEPGSLRDVAGRIGVPKSTIAEAQAHVDTATEFSFMQRWKQYEVLEAHDELAKLPEGERPRVAALLDQPGIPAKHAIGMVRNLATKDAEVRTHIYDLAASADSRDRSRAVTEAAAMPPMPDPRLALLDDARRSLHKAARLFPGDSANEPIEVLLNAFKPAYIAVRGSRRG